jgi:hypothetical protein
MEDPPELNRLSALAPTGRHVTVRAVRRGRLLRDLSGGSRAGIEGLVIEMALKLGSLVLSRPRTGWTIGVVSVDEEPWAGQRVLYREKIKQDDPAPRLQDLRDRIESGDVSIPQPLNWRFHRKPPSL